MNAAAEAVRALASWLRSGMSLRAALGCWHTAAPAACRAALRSLSSRLALGESPPRAVAALDPILGPDASNLAAMVTLHDAIGADLPRMLDRLAATIERRSEAMEHARASGAGAILSGRVVAGLPLLLLPFSPLAGAPLFDPAGIAMLITGAAFALGGLMWMRRLIPRPPEGDDLATAFAELAGAALAGGASLHQALEVAGPAADELAGVRNGVALGLTWPEALALSSDPGLAAVGAVIQRALLLGVPAADALLAFADARRAAAFRAFEAATRRAPVLMAAPLSMCILPAYALLGLGPYVRSLSFGG